MTIAIDILLKSKCHCVVELAFDLTRFFFFLQEIDQQMPNKSDNMFYSKKTEIISADPRFVVPVVSKGD